ncbi:MAG: hypothetical protein JW734_06270 [Candidatus Omnitrophica bacterium]|nr:hypothetical protein [Candidatus Omnitrophota bacterium]
MKNSIKVIRALLVIFTLINFVMAILAFIGGDVATKFITLFYGATVALTPQLTHLIRMFGAMNLAFAFLGLLAYLDPVKNGAIIDGAICLLLVRGVEMLVFSKNIINYFDVSQFRLLQNAASFFIMAILLFIFKPKAKAA